nr:immunoglobulin light chain junction region [Macaca mulatta]
DYYCWLHYSGTVFF